MRMTIPIVCTLCRNSIFNFFPSSIALFPDPVNVCACAFSEGTVDEELSTLANNNINRKERNQEKQEDKRAMTVTGV